MSKLTPFFRKIRWYYILPIYLLGIGYGWYSMYQKQVIPAMATVTESKKAWLASQDTMKTAEGGYDASLKDQITAIKAFYEGYNKFLIIQNTMPEIYDMKSKYTGTASDQVALEEWYRIMGTGVWLTELKKWSAKYNLENAPKEYSFEKVNLGYNDQFSSVKIIGQDFGAQTFHATGYADLVTQVRNRVGYGYCPLIISVGTGGSGAAPGASAPPSAAPATTPKTSALPPLKEKTSWASAFGNLFAIKRPSDEDEPSSPAPAAKPPTPAPAAKPAPAPAAAPAPAPAPAPAAAAELMVITLDSTSPYNPSRPKLSMGYSAKGYFMTKGWNPVPDAQKKLEEGKKIYDNPQPKLPPTPQPGVAPKLLGMIVFPK